MFILSSVIEVTLYAFANSLHTLFYSFLPSSVYLNNIYENPIGNNLIMLFVYFIPQVTALFLLLYIYFKFYYWNINACAKGKKKSEQDFKQIFTSLLGSFNGPGSGGPEATIRK